MAIGFSLYLKEVYCQKNNLEFKTKIKIKNRKGSSKNKNFLKLECFCFFKNS